MSHRKTSHTRMTTRSLGSVEPDLGTTSAARWSFRLDLEKSKSHRFPFPLPWMVLGKGSTFPALCSLVPAKLSKLVDFHPKNEPFLVLSYPLWTYYPVLGYPLVLLLQGDLLVQGCFSSPKTVRPTPNGTSNGSAHGFMPEIGSFWMFLGQTDHLFHH